MRLARRVHDKEDIVRAMRDHQVIEHPACLVGEDPVALPPLGQSPADRAGISASSPASASLGNRTCPMWLTSNKPGMRARPQVLGHHALGVLDGHGIPGERHEFRTKSGVQILQRQLGQRLGRRCRPYVPVLVMGRARPGILRPSRTALSDAPSVLSPEIVIPSADASWRISLQSVSSPAQVPFCLKFTGGRLLLRP